MKEKKGQFKTKVLHFVVKAAFSSLHQFKLLQHKQILHNVSQTKTSHGKGPKTNRMGQYYSKINQRNQIYFKKDNI